MLTRSLCVFSIIMVEQNITLFILKAYTVYTCKRWELISIVLPGIWCSKLHILSYLNSCSLDIDWYGVYPKTVFNNILYIKHVLM